MTLPITTHCPLFASDLRKAAYLKGEGVSQLRLFQVHFGGCVSTTYDVTPAQSIGAAASELKASGIGVT
jgi:hypothetical protein